MARNLYDVGDRPDETGAWLNDKQEKRARMVPVGMVLGALILVGVAVLLLKDAFPDAGKAAKPIEPTSIFDQFSLCDDPKANACVLSGNSYAWRGRAYRIAGISVPSQTDPQCEQEAQRARAARAALATMMNGGTFDSLPDPTDTDPAARILTRDGVSLGQIMILKGHARARTPGPVTWCAPDE
ncbi:nuclease [Sphingobium sp. CAP-1]|uniref:nuclease n=1 Tax=Sphingobium sp. CAP-1 TaxID=2676077 RepID=UPI0012BB2292|nr:nuclease [Sphingobium sp. CAP-1]QGP79881.1 nuclease [Sphingobium sp. CAP-1]